MTTTVASTADAPRTLTFGSVLARAMEARLAELNVAIPARVESYDADRYEISAQPLIHDAFVDESGARVADRPAIIHGVPVMMLGSGGTRVKFPIAVGDTVLLIFAHRSLDRWLVRGGEVDPEDDRRHSRSDAVALPGLQSFADASDADVMIEFTADGKVQIGAGPFIPTGPTGDQLVKAGAIDPFTGQSQAVLNAAFMTGTLLAK